MTQSLERRGFLRLAGGGLAVGWLAPSAERVPPRSKGRALVLGQPQAAEAGMTILKSGGNAVDGVVAAALVAGVVAVPSCGIAGYGGHMTIASADNERVV